MGCYYHHNTKCSTNGSYSVPGHYSRHFSDITSFSPYGNPERYLMIRKLRRSGKVNCVKSHTDVTELGFEPSPSDSNALS